MTEITSAWPRYPGYRVDVEPLEGIGRAHVGGLLVAESRRCLLVRESDHHDQLYVPVEDVVVPLLPSGHRTVCPFKGEAQHWSLDGPSGVVQDAVWGYPDPFDEVAGIRGHVAFYTDRVDVTAAVPFGDGDESVSRFPVWGTAADLTALMDATPEGDGDDGDGDGDGPARYRVPGFPDPPLGTFIEKARALRARNVVEGGQLLGATIAAASRTRPDLRVTAATIVFAGAAHFDAPLDLEVDTRRAGRTIGTFDVRVSQEGALRASALVMADAGADDLIRHAAPLPDVAPPADSPPQDYGVIGRELRIVDGAYQDQDRTGPPELHVWSRFAHDPGPERLHQALLAQSSTHWAIAAGLRPHPGITQREAHHTMSMGPLSVSLAFHDHLDVTSWLLTEITSIYAGRGSTQAQTRTWDREGRLVASSTVQAMVRAFAGPPGPRDAATAM
jgi:acyl-CoA thioesterase II